MGNPYISTLSDVPTPNFAPNPFAITKNPDWNPREADVWRFTEGDCHVLARRVYRITGWPVMEGWVEDGGEGYADAHCVNRHPSGDLLDIEGLHNSAVLAERYGVSSWRMTPVEKCASFWGEPSHPYSWKRARIIADRLVKAHPYQSAMLLRNEMRIGMMISSPFAIISSVGV